MLLIVPPVLCDATLISHDKIHVAPCVNHLDVTNKMVPVAMLSVLCDAHADANSVRNSKESRDTFFQLSSHKEKMVSFMMHVASYDSDAGAMASHD